MRTLLRSAGLGALLLAAVAGAPRAAGAETRPHVLLVTVDTLRADALHSYGFPEPITPVTDGLAERGTLFEKAASPIGKTGPAFASLFTSLYPPTHGARRNGVPMRPDVPAWAEILRDAGYQTAGFISNWTLRSRLAAVERGFEHWDQEFDRRRYGLGPRERAADSVIEAALEWLDDERDRERPLFLWTHFSEPHTPYDLHRGFGVPEPTGTDRQGPLWSKRWRYASEVAYTDHKIGELLAALDRRLEGEPRLLLFLADHGESLGEHDYWGHGKNTHWANLDVPLILVGPGVPAGRRVATPVSLVDVLPTVLELLDLSVDSPLEGRSLVPALTGSLDAAERYAFADRHTAFKQRKRERFEHPLEIALEWRGAKVIHDFDQGETRYYDLVEDPRETEPLRKPSVDLRPPLGRRLVNWYRELTKYEAETGELSPEDIEQLESLGYVGGP